MEVAQHRGGNDYRALPPRGHGLVRPPSPPLLPPTNQFIRRCHPNRKRKYPQAAEVWLTTINSGYLHSRMQVTLHAILAKQRHGGSRLVQRKAFLVAVKTRRSPVLAL